MASGAAAARDLVPPDTVRRWHRERAPLWGIPSEGRILVSDDDKDEEGRRVSGRRLRFSEKVGSTKTFTQLPSVVHRTGRVLQGRHQVMSGHIELPQQTKKLSRLGTRFRKQ